jgi:putative tricarboxylic transport membrane protein
MKVRTAFVDIVVGFAAIALLVGVVVLSERFPQPHRFQLGAAVFPRTVAALLALVGGSIALTRIVAALRRASAANTDLVEIESPRQVFTALAALILFGMLLRPLGFLIVTPLFLLFMMRLLGVRSWVAVVLTAALSTAGIWIVFDRLLGVPLPNGLLGL